MTFNSERLNPVSCGDNNGVATIITFNCINIGVSEQTGKVT